MAFLTGKRLLITGVLSNRSIAYGIAKACHREGAELAFTYVGERFRDRVAAFAAEFGSNLCLEMDVSSDEQIQAVTEKLRNEWGYLDGFVHSIGFAPREAIAGDFLSGLSRSGFRTAMDISTYSFPALAQAFLPLMQGRQASILTLTYLGSERTVPNYNTMGLCKAALEASTRYLAESLGPQGIRANAISSGPIKTLAASGIKDFEDPQLHGTHGAPAPHGDDRRGRQHRRLPLVGLGQRHHGRYGLRRRRFPWGCRGAGFCGLIPSPTKNAPRGVFCY